MNYVKHLQNDIKEIIGDPELVDVISEFVEAAEMSPNDIITFYPDLYKGGLWVFTTTRGIYEMQQAHTAWDPDVVVAQIEKISD